MISVISVIGITDYVYMFEDVARNDVVGIKEVKVLRFSADADGIILQALSAYGRMVS